MPKKRHFKLPVLLRAWIVIAAVVLAHAAAVSGGIAEPLYLWQLRRYQAVDEGTTMLALLAVVIGLPALVLTFMTPRSRRPPVPFDARHKRQALIGSGACILVLAALGMITLIPILSRPSSGDRTLPVTLDGPREPPRESRATVTGVPRPDYRVNYDQVSFGWKYGGTSRTRRTLIPVTPKNWTLETPVTIIMDTRGRDWRELMRPSADSEWTSRPGYLLPDQLTGYERRALGDVGVTVADGVMLYSTDRLSGTAGLTAFAIICGCVGLVLLIGFIATAFMKPRG